MSFNRLVVVVDCDGTVSPVRPRSPGAWGDEVDAGWLFGAVRVSPRLCRRLDAIARLPGVECWWLSSWTAVMRARMAPFPGAEWPEVADPLAAPRGPHHWWKLNAVRSFLATQGPVTGFAWLDDELAPARAAAVRRVAAAAGVARTHLARPATDVGLSPADVDELAAWCAVDTDRTDAGGPTSI